MSWRLLEPDEIVRDGDEVWSLCDANWVGIHKIYLNNIAARDAYGGLVRRRMDTRCDERLKIAVEAADLGKRMADYVRMHFAAIGVARIPDPVLTPYIDFLGAYSELQNDAMKRVKEAE